MSNRTATKQIEIEIEIRPRRQLLIDNHDEVYFFRHRARIQYTVHKKIYYDIIIII